ncbi:hypothetical protein KAU39_02030 [bacterium]|nr:hypothetical protein [bacterium]
MLILISTQLTKAQESNLKISGELLTDQRFLLQDQNDWAWNENRLTLNFDKKITDYSKFYGEIWLRNIGLPNISSSADLYNKNIVDPYNLEVREAYVELYGFLLKNLDIKIGRQRIAWGTADKLNPTDNLNPDDLEDIMDFGRKLSTNSMKLTYYLGGYTFTGVCIPLFTPAVLPSSEWASALSSPISFPDGITLRNFTDSIILPEDNPEESSTLAVKIAGNLLNNDLSVSYFYGRDDLPLINKVEITPITSTTVDIRAEMIYPRMHVIGVDLAGAIGDIGIWTEVACFIPEKVKMETFTTGVGTQTSIALKEEVYFKHVSGWDYTFKNGLYINSQFLHGFIHERGKSNLEDYFMAGIEKKFFNDELKVKLSFGVEIKDWDKIENNSATMIFPEVNYYPVDNTEIILGAYLIDGKDTTNFGKVKNNDEVYLKFKYSF